MGKTSGTRKKSAFAPPSGASAGAGWGGPASGGRNQHPPFEEGNPIRPSRITAATLARHERIEALNNTLVEIALDDEIHPATRVMAADKALDRLVGKPVQPVVTGKAGIIDVSQLSNDDIQRELEALSRAQTLTIEGTSEAADEGVVP